MSTPSLHKQPTITFLTMSVSSFQCYICKKHYDSDRALTMHQRKAHPYNYDHILKTTADITTADGHADSDFTQLATQGEDHYHQMEPPEPEDSRFQGSDDSSSEAGDDVNAFEAGTAGICSRKRSPADKHHQSRG